MSHTLHATPVKKHQAAKTARVLSEIGYFLDCSCFTFCPQHIVTRLWNLNCKKVVELFLLTITSNFHVLKPKVLHSCVPIVPHPEKYYSLHCVHMEI